jgi:hypothetical protein
MVKGIDPFKAHFEGFSDRYVLIGGVACFLSLDEAGLDFRVTKDLDIVLCVEALDVDVLPCRRSSKVTCNALWRL